MIFAKALMWFIKTRVFILDLFHHFQNKTTKIKSFRDFYVFFNTELMVTHKNTSEVSYFFHRIEIFPIPTWKEEDCCPSSQLLT